MVPALRQGFEVTVGATMPNPEGAGDLAEFIEALGLLRLWAGAPSYRTLAKRVGPLLPEPQTVAATTVADVFHPQRRRLDFDLVVAIVRALGLPEPTVSRWRQACVRVHGEAKASVSGTVTRQFPTSLATFTGRAEPLRRLLEATTPAGTDKPDSTDNTDTPPPTVLIASIEGMAGVGKTQLAVHAANQLLQAGHYKDVQLYVNLRGFDPDQPPADPYEVLGGFLRALGVPAPQTPATLDDRAAMFRDRMHGRQALILLDNAADEEQLHHLIPSATTCAVLITSRRSLVGLDSATVHRLDILTPREAHDLLRRITGPERVDAEPEAADQLLTLCGQLPLAVVLTASRLRARPSWSLAQLVERLRDRPLDTAGGGRNLRGVFDVSYLSLPPHARRLYRLLGLNPGTDLTAETAAALADLDPATAGEILETLLDEHLLEQRTYGRYEFHDLLRDYARQAAAAEETPETRHTATDRYMRYHLHAAANAIRTLSGRPNEAEPDGEPPVTPPPMDTAEQARTWLDAEHANLLATSEATATGHWHDHGWQLSSILGTYLHLLCENTAWIAMCRRALTSARHLDNPRAIAISEKNLATAHLFNAEFDDARPHLNAALDLMRQLGDLDGQAGLENNMALADYMDGRFQDAVDHYLRCLDLCRQLGYTTRMSTPLSNLAISLCRLERYEEALEHAQESLTLVHQSAEIKGECYSHHAIASAHLGLENYDLALEAFQNALTASRAVGNRGNEMSCLDGIARTYARQEQYEDAYRYHEEALAVADKIGDAKDLARALNHLAETQSRDGRRAEAHETYKRALAVAWNEYEQVRARKGIADTAAEGPAHAD